MVPFLQLSPSLPNPSLCYPILPTLRLCCPTSTPRSRCLQAGHSRSRVDFLCLCVRYSHTSGAVVRPPHLLQQTVVRYSFKSLTMTDHRPVLGATRPTQHTTGQGLAQLGGSCLLGDSLCGGKPAGSPNPNHKRAPCVLTLQKNGMQADKCVMVHTVTVHT